MNLNFVVCFWIFALKFVAECQLGHCAPARQLLQVSAATNQTVEDSETGSSDRKPSNPEPTLRFVTSLLANLLKDTLYKRMEQLLLGPPHPPAGHSKFQEEEKRKLLDFAVKNYQEQNIHSVNQEKGSDNAKSLPGIWIRATEEPKVLASIFTKSPQTDGEKSSSLRKENYKITDLFAAATPPSSLT